jgi:hypothetical protein
MLTRLFIAGSQTGARLQRTKAIKGRTNILPHLTSILTFWEVFVGCVPVEKLLMRAQCLPVSRNASSYALPENPVFNHLELAKGLEPLTL